MYPLGKSPLRFAIYGAVIAYLAGDFFIFEGPLHRAVTSDRPPRSERVARVGGTSITHSQLERAVSDQLWLEGKSADLVSPGELEIARKSALDELIDHELLRLQIKTSREPLAVSYE
jgi:hypothetical protein